MSDSDWEVLSTDGEGMSFPTPTRPLEEIHEGVAPAVRQTRDHCPHLRQTLGAAVAASNTSDASTSAPQRDTALVPLCLTINQTGTRFGVGHATGFLVFRVVSEVAVADELEDVLPSPSRRERRRGDPAGEDAAAGQAPSGKAPRRLPAQGRLVLDPQYNIDMWTFSQVRQRMRKQQQEREETSVRAKGPTTTAASLWGGVGLPHPLVMDDCIASQSHHPREAGKAAERSGPSLDKIHSEDERERKVGSRSRAFDIDDEDIGSFLTTARGAFAQIKREEGRGPPMRVGQTDSPWRPHQKPSQAASEDVTGHTVAVEHTAAVEPAVRCADEGGRPSSSASASCDAARRALPHAQTALPNSTLAASSVASPLRSSSPAADVGDTGRSSDSDKLVTKWSFHATSTVRRSSTGTCLSGDGASDVLAVQADYEDAQEDFVGFEGGGVAVMTLLYEQTWMAVVGGGVTPMGPPNEVQFLRDGERQHRLQLPDPVMRLFLDARLLFVFTTSEMRLYTNPLEREWTCLRQTLPISSGLGRRIAPAVAPNGAPVNLSPRITEPPPVLGSPTSAAVDAEESPLAVSSVFLASTSSHECDDRQAERAGQAGGSPLPTFPVVVDYAHNVLLLPAGREGTDFALYQYLSGPEISHVEPFRSSERNTGAATAPPGAQDTRDAVASAELGSQLGVTTGRTTASLQLLAFRREAHRNRLHNLALYIGWPTAITRLMPKSSTDTGDFLAAGSDAVHPGTPSGDGRVTLVAASSEYATRLTLWMLRATERNATAAQLPSSTVTHAFVLLREFRVRVRLAAPPSMMASLPGVSKCFSFGQAALSGTSSQISHGSGAELPSSGNSTSRTVASLMGGMAGGLLNSSMSGSSRPATSNVLSAPSAHARNVASWATSAVATVAQSAVQHLQFVGDGAYLLCVHGADTISIFSTSARETDQELKNACRDHVAAEKNRYSRLTAMREYLPRALSTRLEAYTRQAWSSCSGHLPTADATFMPRWIQTHADEAGAVVAASRARLRTAHPKLSPSNSSSCPPPTVPSAPDSCGVVDVSSRHHKDGSGGRHLLQRLTSLVGPRRAWTAAAAISTPNVGVSLSSTDARTSVKSYVLSECVAASPHRQTSSIPSDATHCQRGEERIVWGTPFNCLVQCIHIWSPPPHSGSAVAPRYASPVFLSSSSSSSGAARESGAASVGRPPITLNCATCEGAFANIFLFAEEGEILTSTVLRYASE